MPLLGARGGGSVRGFGRFGKNLLLSLIDSFNRSTSGSLGTSSDGKGLWKNVRGTWQGNGSLAVSAGAASDNNVAAIDMDGTNITNLQVDTGTSGGSGLSFWVTDSNNYYAFYPSYTQSSSSSSSCSGSYGSNSPTPCSSVAGNGQFRIVYCCNGVTFRMGPCDGNDPNGLCTNAYGSSGGQCGTQWDGWASCYSTYPTTVTTTYNSIVNLRKVEGGSVTNLISSNYVSNTSGYSKARSLAISTSGNTISYSLYSSTGKGGSVIGSGSNTPSNPVKGVGMGLFHGQSTIDQGSTLSNFSVTVTP
jgi:hypothetical protein